MIIDVEVKAPRESTNVLEIFTGAWLRLTDVQMVKFFTGTEVIWKITMIIASRETSESCRCGEAYRMPCRVLFWVISGWS
jgi:hypothetical protein